eukprot:1137235-Pelagomonas_calceolata.AAC.1
MPKLLWLSFMCFAPVLQVGRIWLQNLSCFKRVTKGLQEGYKGKRPQSGRLTASLFINTHEIMKEKRKSVVVLTPCNPNLDLTLAIVGDALLASALTVGAPVPASPLLAHLQCTCQCSSMLPGKHVCCMLPGDGVEAKPQVRHLAPAGGHVCWPVGMDSKQEMEA